MKTEPWSLKIIAEQLKIYIALYKPICETNKHKDACYYGNPQYQRINIGLIDEHYFLIEKTNFTSYSIINYFDVYDKLNFNRIYSILYTLSQCDFRSPIL